MKVADFKRGNMKTLKTKSKVFGILTLVGLVMFVLFSVLQMTSIAIIFAVATPIFFLIWVQNHNGVKRLLNIYCQCGRKFEYPQDVEVISQSEIQNLNRNGNNINRVTRTNVKFRCTCPKCVKTKDFNFAFITKEERIHPMSGATLDSIDYPLKDQIKNYFEN